MGSFNPQILMDKLTKLNNSQASIETLSHWCIFHMNKAKQVVETWERQFHCSPPEQRLAFLYLANDILQNSRRKGSEFVGEFWKVLPGALRHVIDNGDEFGKNAAFRLINIWEERKVFGSRGQILKEEIVGRQTEGGTRNAKQTGIKLKSPVGNTVDNIVSTYQVLYGGQMDEDIIMSTCRNAFSSLEKVEREIGADANSGQFHRSGLVEEAHEQHVILKDCIKQLRVVESSRTSLVSHLREALQEQEIKLEQVRTQLQAAQSLSDQVSRQLLNSDNAHLVPDQNSKEAQSMVVPRSFPQGDGEQSAPVMYARQVSFPESSSHGDEDPRKSAAAAVAAKLTASTSSAQMLSYVLSSLASEGVISGNAVNESSSEYPTEKRSKLETDQSYILPRNPQPLPPAPPFSHQETLQHNINTSEHQKVVTPSEKPPPPQSSPPPLPPLPPMPSFPVPQYMQTSGLPYSYNISPLQPPSLSGYQMVGGGPPIPNILPFTTAPQNSYPNVQGAEAFYNQSTSMPMAPIGRQ